jgi:hypothetical protein
MSGRAAIVTVMRPLGAMALLGLALGCGRSGLADELGITGADIEGGVPGASSASPPVEDGSVQPVEDGSVQPVEEGNSTAPAENVSFPPVEDVSVPPTEDVSVPTGGCSYATCSGCCDANGGCHQGSDTSACGGQGEQCLSCNQLCVDGICLNLDSNCGPSNCTGCCLGNDVCTDGLHAGACGSGGMQCESCNPATSGGKCVASTAGTGGACTSPASAACNDTICPMGCCVGDLCVQGTQDIACGSGGQDCTQNGRTCIGRTCSF